MIGKTEECLLLFVAEMISPLYDTQSKEYKKAKRDHDKTTRNRKLDVDQNWSQFRAAEKRFKARFPPPDLSSILDLAAGLNGTTQPSRISTNAFIIPEVPGLVLLPSFVSEEDQRRLVRWSLRDHARHPNETNLDAHYLLPSEGIWNAHLKSQSQGAEAPLVRTKASLDGEHITRSSTSGPRQLISNDPASVNNLSTLQSLPKPPPDSSTTVSDCPSSDLIPKLRWANIGWSYHWGSKQYDFTKGKGDINPFLRDICKRAVESVPWEKVFGNDTLDGWGDDDDWRLWKDTYEPDAGIVNFYQIKDTLMAHVDRSEVCATSPLVSISIGNAAIFLIGGLTRDTEPIPILLRSGDIVIMSGPAGRRAYHGVPRILEGTLPEHFSQPPDEGDDVDDWEPYKDFMQTTRININVRQVFPKGFDPTYTHDTTPH